MKIKKIALLCGLLLTQPLFATTSHQIVTDPSRRYIIVHNDLPMTIYPVVEVPEDGNCVPKSTAVNRIVVPAGVQFRQTIKIYVPDKCWYNAGRVLLFTPPIETFETRIDSAQQTQKGSASACYDISQGQDNEKGITCYTGKAKASYPLDSPAQLTEYTFDADDPLTGKKSSDPDQGRLMTDIDISYVDETFLPVTMAIDTGGLAGYMGTNFSYADFKNRIMTFLQTNNWSSFAAYTQNNWSNNVFHDLVPFSYHTLGGYNLLNSVNTKATSLLYKPDAGAAYLIEKLSINQKYQPSNPAVTALAARWKQWLSPNNPCTSGNIPANLAVDQKGFCQDFQATVKWVWEIYNGFKSNDPNYCKFVAGDGKAYEIDDTVCLMEHILGYKKGPDGGQLPESVQAILRGVPWNDEKSGKPLYQYNKWLLFWAPTDSAYNLNPFTRLIHNETDGINAVAYSFSIDDKYGNFRDEGTGFIINAGGDSYLSNKSMYDPYQQYFVTWAANNWDHATICGRNVNINMRAGNSRVSMWQNGKKMDYCDVTLYRSNQTEPHLDFRLSEEAKRIVTDSYTGKQHEVQGLKMDVQYCKENSSPILAAYCDRANLSPVYKGDIAYVSLKNEAKPSTTLNMAALVTGGRLNLAPGWLSATGCGFPDNAGKIDPKNGSSFPFASGNASSCTAIISGAAVKVNLNVTFNADGEIIPQSVKCTKADSQSACAGVVVDPNNVNFPPPNAI